MCCHCMFSTFTYGQNVGNSKESILKNIMDLYVRLRLSLQLFFLKNLKKVVTKT